MKTVIKVTVQQTCIKMCNRSAIFANRISHNNYIKKTTGQGSGTNNCSSVQHLQEKQHRAEYKKHLRLGTN